MWDNMVHVAATGNECALPSKTAQLIVIGN